MRQALSPRPRPFVAILCVALLGACLPGTGWTLARVDLYQANAPAADRTEAGQTAAFQAALKVVLVRVTGGRNVEEDAALAPLIANARRYVQQYRPATDGSLWVSFDGPAIERWLTQNGQPLWGRERPATVVFLAAQNGAAGGLISAEDSSELKAAVDAAAAQRGLPLIWPSSAELQKNRLDYAGVATGSLATLTELAHRLGGEGVLVGKASDKSALATVRWTHQFQDRTSEYSGTLEGVNRAADLYASLFAASGTLLPVEIEVTGVADVRDYASIETFLESQTSIAHVSVESLSGDTVRFRLATRGGGESLQRALSLNGRLRPLPAGDNGIQRFQLHR
jgi:hypothetical protein